MPENTGCSGGSNGPAVQHALDRALCLAMPPGKLTHCHFGSDVPEQSCRCPCCQARPDTSDQMPQRSLQDEKSIWHSPSGTPAALQALNSVKHCWAQEGGSRGPNASAEPPAMPRPIANSSVANFLFMFVSKRINSRMHTEPTCDIFQLSSNGNIASHVMQVKHYLPCMNRLMRAACTALQPAPSLPLVDPVFTPMRLPFSVFLPPSR